MLPQNTRNDNILLVHVMAILKKGKLDVVFVFCFFIDVDTRRRAACDFVRGLCQYFEQPVIAIFSHYVTMLLEVCCFREAFLVGDKFSEEYWCNNVKINIL